MESGVQRFGNVEFVPLRRRLWVAGRRVDLDRPAAAILSLLLTESPADVDKHRLLEAGWPGRMVDENSLAKAICRLRGALGDDGTSLETVHGFGYRISAEVETVPVETRRYRVAIPGRHLASTALSIGVILVALGTWKMAGPITETFADAPVVNGEAAGSVGRILWVDDHPGNNETEKRFFERRKVGVYQVGSTDDALKLLPMYAYDVVISDMGRGDRPLAGLDLLEAMRDRGDKRPFLLYTVHSSQAQHKLIAQSGGQGVAETPEQLYSAVLPLFEKPRP
jgi:DNA-binding response OmpR family regulator